MPNKQNGNLKHIYVLYVDIYAATNEIPHTHIGINDLDDNLNTNSVCLFVCSLGVSLPTDASNEHLCAAQSFVQACENWKTVARGLRAGMFG